MTTWPEFQPTRLLSQLAAGGVDFVVIGGVAVIAQASPRFTKDLDISYSLTPENLKALGSVLVGLKATVRGIDEDLAFKPDERTLRQTQILCLNTPLGGLDLLVRPDGCPPYEELREHADVITLGGVEVRIAAIEDLISMKSATGCPQDLIDVEALEVAKRRLGGSRRPR